MITTLRQPIEHPTQPQPQPQPPKQLIARWRLVQGELICKWIKG